MKWKHLESLQTVKWDDARKFREIKLETNWLFFSEVYQIISCKYAVFA